ncbi:hypothetical protein Celaphus_00003621, partial [Cervus elaphus hippelaphus]
MTVEEGRFCRMDFKVSGLPAPDVSWYLNGRPVQSDDFHKMIVSEKGFHSLIFEVVRASDAGAYACVAKNRAGEATFTVQLEVLAPKQLRVRPTFSKYLALNGKGLNVKQAFNPEGEFQRLAAQSGLYESEEL